MSPGVLRPPRPPGTGIGRSGSLLESPDAPQLNFGRRTGTIFDRSGRSPAFRDDVVRTPRTTMKTGKRSTLELSRAQAKAAANRSEGAFDGTRRIAGAQVTLRRSLRASVGGLGNLSVGLGRPKQPGRSVIPTGLSANSTKTLSQKQKPLASSPPLDGTLASRSH